MDEIVFLIIWGLAGAGGFGVSQASAFVDCYVMLLLLYLTIYKIYPHHLQIRLAAHTQRDGKEATYIHNMTIDYTKLGMETCLVAVWLFAHRRLAFSVLYASWAWRPFGVSEAMGVKRSETVQALSTKLVHMDLCASTY
eukprot:1836242-Amphidinium_carterae.1